MEPHKPLCLVSVNSDKYHPSYDQLMEAAMNEDVDVYTQAIDSLRVVEVYLDWWKKAIGGLND